MPELLRDHTTLRLGGPARDWVRATTEDALVDAVRRADEAGEPLLVLGGGSNLVVADEGFDGTVVEVATSGVHADVEDDDPTCGGVVVQVAAGESWDAFVATAVERRLGRRRGAVRHPRLGRRDPDPERRRLRPGGLPDDQPGPRVGPATQGRPHLRCRRLRLRLPHQPVQGRPVAPRRPRRHLPVPAGRPRRAGGVRRAGPHPRRRAGRPRADGRRTPCGARPAGRQGHGARPGRPRHLERRLLLHQPGARAPSACPTALPRGRSREAR